MCRGSRRWRGGGISLQEGSHIDWEECDVIFNFQVLVVDEVGSGEVLTVFCFTFA